MSCNGCRVLRKGCGDACVLRPCLQWIESADAQGHATVFVAKFFGRAGLMSFISAVPDPQRPALFRSLLFEACGRTINPVNGAVGLLWTGNWHLCQAAVDTVLRGGTLRPQPDLGASGNGPDPESSVAEGPLHERRAKAGWSFPTAKRRKGASAAEGPQACDLDLGLSAGGEGEVNRRPRPATPSMNSEESVMTSAESGRGYRTPEGHPRVLDLFV